MVPVQLLLKVENQYWMRVVGGGGARGHAPPPASNNSQKYMATGHGDLYFMFLGPHLQNFWIGY